ncbi:MAG: response regulator transcription factor [Thermoleophilaceae bacterium]
MPAEPVRVLICDDDDLLRSALQMMLTVDEGIVVVAEVADGRDAAAQAREHAPDVALMDVRMPGLDGIEATRELLAAAPDTRVIVLTTFEDDRYIFGALKAGASGFLLKRTSPELLVAAIRTVADGDALLSPSVTRRVLERMATHPLADAGGSDASDELTPREREVLVLIASGLTNHEIADELTIEESTVKTHVRRILAKLNLRDRIHAVVYAYETGLIRAGRR